MIVLLVVLLLITTLSFLGLSRGFFFVVTLLFVGQCGVVEGGSYHSYVVAGGCIAANVASAMSAESGHMTETYGDIETCRQHVRRICTYIYLHMNSYMAYIRTSSRHKKNVSPQQACRGQHR